jgi:DNA-binding LacI/PurR family transcriptional regulator
MSQTEKVTITDVARSAGVAVGTVSRVLNNIPDVNPEIRAHVLQTAQKLGYTRIRRRKTSGEARKIAAAATLSEGDIGIIFFGMQDSLVQLPVINRSLQGIERSLSALGRNLLLANIPDGRRVPPFLSEGRVKGVILKGPNQGFLPSPDDCELLRAVYAVPHLWLMGRLPNATGDHCNFDTELAGRIVAEHLKAKGQQRVAFLNPKPGQAQFERVKRSFFASCAVLGLEATLLETEPPASREWPLPATTLMPNVELLVQRWIKLPVEKRPTTLFVPSDRTALQLDSALKQNGLRMGVDVGVVSCNNETSIISTLNPELTTLDVHAELIGQTAVSQLLWRIQNPSTTPAMQVLIEPTLIERASVPQR